MIVVVQMCTGEKIATGEKETINSATKKCELLKCVAANAQPDSHGSYTVWEDSGND